jgi:hypothetical protein
MSLRHICIRFLAAEILRDYWLSGVSDWRSQALLSALLIILLIQPYGRNWSFLWAVPIPKWKILLLVAVFFVGVWAAMLVILTHFSKTHTWLLPVFAVGLGAPRWCQVSRNSIWKSYPDPERHGADAVGYVLASLVHSLGWLCRPISRDFALALAGCSRRYSGCGTGHDFAPGDLNRHSLGSRCDSPCRRHCRAYTFALRSPFHKSLVRSAS